MRKMGILLAAGIVLSTVATGPLGRAVADNTMVLSSPLSQAGSEPVTFYMADQGVVLTLDPQKMSDSGSVHPVENLFIGLTDVDPRTTQIRPEMATSWERSPDGATWLFNLRDDIFWVRHDMTTGQTSQVRKVTAADFEYGIKRACDPRLGAYYTSVVAGMIEGCNEVAVLPLASIQESDFDQIAVRALSDTQLEIKTRGTLGFFLSATSMWMMRAAPRETIEELGEAWSEPANIVTSGPFVINQWDEGAVREYLANPFYPADVGDRYGGNVERVVTYLVDFGTAYSLYQNGELDRTGLPQSEAQRLRADPTTANQVIQLIEPSVFYFGFMYDKPPFDNIHVRRAFSAIIDRADFVEGNIAGQGVPISHFMPPGIRGSVGINEVGLGEPENLGFDPEYAVAEMEKAGYPNCEGFPQVTILTYAGASDWGDYLALAASNYLNCDPTQFTVEAADFGTLLETIKKTTPSAQRPNIHTLGWIADYPDAHNWMHDVLGCNADNPFMRPCSDVDLLIDAAAREADPEKRNQLYRQIEQAFFDEGGEFPIAPLYVPISLLVIQPWVRGFFQTDGQFGGEHWDSITIDVAQQSSARSATGE
jgi:oligopeptide transport system substrate-binding protein